MSNLKGGWEILGYSDVFFREGVEGQGSKNMEKVVTSCMDGPFADLQVKKKDWQVEN